MKTKYGLVGIVVLVIFVLAISPAQGVQNGTAVYLPFISRSLTFPLPAHPLNLQLTPDLYRTQAKLIGKDGGQLTTEDFEGTQFILTIPAGALSELTLISIAPLREVSGLTGGARLVAGLQITPDHLYLNGLATLTIVPIGYISPTREFPLGYLGNGEDLYLAPLVRKPSEVIFPMTRLDSRIYAAYPGSWPADPGWVPTDVHSQLQHVAAGVFHQQNIRSGAYYYEAPGLEGDLQEVLIQRNQEYFRTYLQPRLSSAQTDCEHAVAVISEALAWIRPLDFFAISEVFQAEIDQVITTAQDAYQGCWNDLVQPCIENFRVAASIEHQAAMIGILLSPPLESVALCSQAQWSGMIRIATQRERTLPLEYDWLGTHGDSLYYQDIQTVTSSTGSARPGTASLSLAHTVEARLSQFRNYHKSIHYPCGDELWFWISQTTRLGEAAQPPTTSVTVTINQDNTYTLEVSGAAVTGKTLYNNVSWMFDTCEGRLMQNPTYLIYDPDPVLIGDLANLTLSGTVNRETLPYRLEGHAVFERDDYDSLTQDPVMVAVDWALRWSEK